MHHLDPSLVLEEGKGSMTNEKMSKLCLSSLVILVDK